MTQRAKFKNSTAWLGHQFGEQYARKLFGDTLIDSLPRNTRGKYIGAIKGNIDWIKCTEGGWVSTGRDVMRGESIGRVENRVGKVVYARLRDNNGQTVAEYGDVAYA